MRSLAIRLPFAALSALALMIALAPMAAAAPSDADRLLAVGAGTTYTAAVGATSFQDTACFTDPTGDVTGPNGQTVAEPRGDMVEHCVDFGEGFLSLSVTTAQPVDPEEDANWAGSLLGWFISTDGDADGEFFVSLSQDDAGAIEVTVEDRSTDPATEVEDCNASYDGFEGGAIQARLAATCIGEPADVRVSPGLIYDQRVSSASGVATSDIAPNEGDFEQPVDADQPPVDDGGLEPGITRLAGAERIATAIEISQEGWADGGSDTVLLARADLFPDALAGTPLAVEADAPILLTPTDSLSDLTLTEIERVTNGSGTVIILGGELAISAEVEQALTDAGYTTVRYGGTNRFETAVEIATDGLGSPSTVLAADGGDFQDALIAGTAAPSVDGAVLLTDGETVPPATQAYLDATATDVTAIGADAAAALPEADAVAGADPIETAVLAAEAFYPDTTVAGAARVDVFADALTGGALIANPRLGPGPMLFVETDSLPALVESYLQDNPIDTVVIFGGVDAVSQDVEDAIEAAIA